MATVEDSWDKFGSKTSLWNTEFSDPVAHWEPQNPATPSWDPVLLLWLNYRVFFYTFSIALTNKAEFGLRSSEPTPYPADMIPDWIRTESVSKCSLVLVHGGRWRKSVRPGVAVIWVRTGSWCIFWAAGRGGSSARSGAANGPFWSSPARNGSTWPCCPRPRSASGSAG